MRWKASLWAGVSMLAKYAVLVIFVRILLQTNYQLWGDGFHALGGPKWLRDGFVSEIIALIPSVILLYIVGRFSLSRFAPEKTARKVHSWLLLMQGGYKKVWFEGYGPGTAREKVGIVLGKSIVQRPNGKSEKRIIVSRARIPLMPEPLPLEQAPIIKNKFNPWVYELLGFNLPERLELQAWTDDLFQNLPEYQHSAETETQPNT